jgi:acyl-CoA synthetase (NDP forming)
MTPVKGGPGRLDKVFYPDSIAVVGVSSRMDNPGTLALRSIMGMGFDGPIYPVNPKYGEIMGLTCYPSIREVPSPPDLVLLAIPPGDVPAVVAECAEVGVWACVINSAGFSETGRPETIDLERRILHSIKTSNLRIVGPNCMGVYSSSGKIALFDGQRPGSGRVSLISQSGSLASFLYLLGAERATSTALISWSTSLTIRRPR